MKVMLMLVCFAVIGLAPGAVLAAEAGGPQQIPVENSANSDEDGNPEIRPSQRLTNTWTGLISTDWGNYLNWSLAAVPTSSHDVQIPAGVSSYPVVSTYTAICQNLSVDTGARITISTGKLTVGQIFDNSGLLRMTATYSELIVNSHLRFNSGSSTYHASAATNTLIIVKGYLEFHLGSSVYMNTGTISLEGDTDSWIFNYTPTSINDLSIHKTNSATAGISGWSNTTLSVNNLRVLYGSIFRNYYMGTTIVRKSFYVNAGGRCYLEEGTICMESEDFAPVIRFDDEESYLNNLEVNKINPNSYLLVEQFVRVKGNLTVQSGWLYVSGQLTVETNWNTQGRSFHFPGSRVVFGGNHNQYIESSEDFENLELDKSAGALRIWDENVAVTCNSYKRIAGTLSVAGGSLLVRDLDDWGITGTINLSAGRIDIHQDLWEDLAILATLNISGGELHLYGGSQPTRIPYGGNATLNLSGGLIHRHDKGIIIHGLWDLTTSITGGVIRCEGYFENGRTSFAPAGGTVELYGLSNTTLKMPVGSLHHLVINKTEGARGVSDEQPPGNATPDRVQSVSLLSNLVCTGDLTVLNGVFDLAGFTANIGGDILVHDQLRMDVASAKAASGNDFHWFEGSLADATAGTFECNADWYVDQGAIVNLPSSVNTVLTGSGSSVCLSDPETQFGALQIGGSAVGAGYTLHTDSIRDLAVAGVLAIIAGNTLSLNQKDLFAAANLMLAGTLNLQGNSAEITGRAEFAAGSTLNVGSGNFLCHDTSLPRVTSLWGNLNIGSGTFSYANNALSVEAGSASSISSGNIICGGIGATNPNTFQPAGGTVKISGNSANETATLNVSANNWLPNLQIDTSAGAELAASLTVTGNLNVESGALDLNGRDLNCAGNVTIDAAGTLRVVAASTLRLADAKTLSVNDGGWLEVIGTVSQPASVSSASGKYDLGIEAGGTIAASHAVFQQLRSDGVNVKPGANVDPANSFSACTFSNGTVGGTLLTLNNDQNLLISEAVFPINIWGGASNIRKVNTAGFVNVANSGGAFSGEDHDDDDFDRILWTNPSFAPDLRIVHAAWSDASPHLGDSVNLDVMVLNASTSACEACWLDFYQNQADQPLPGSGGDRWLRIPPLDAGLPSLHTFTLSNYDPATLGLWNAWLQIDTYAEIAEDNESNNTHGPVLLNWQQLPAIENLSITHVPATNSLRLDWTYPLDASSFRIYRSTNPFFVPGPENLRQRVDGSVLLYSEPASGPCYFYQVSAERLPALKEESPIRTAP